jgi:hypothetical protein
MKIILKEPVNLTGVITPAGTTLEVTPEFGAKLIKEEKAEELGFIRKLQERIETAVEKKPEVRNKSKDN